MTDTSPFFENITLPEKETIKVLLDGGSKAKIEALRDIEYINLDIRKKSVTFDAIITDEKNKAYEFSCDIQYCDHEGEYYLVSVNSSDDEEDHASMGQYKPLHDTWQEAMEAIRSVMTEQVKLVDVEIDFDLPFKDITLDFFRCGRWEFETERDLKYIFGRYNISTGEEGTDTERLERKLQMLAQYITIETNIGVGWESAHLLRRDFRVKIKLPSPKTDTKIYGNLTCHSVEKAIKHALGGFKDYLNTEAVTITTA